MKLAVRKLGCPTGRPPVKRGGLYSLSKYLPTPLWNTFCSGWKSRLRCRSTFPGLRFLWLHKLSICSENLLSSATFLSKWHMSTSQWVLAASTQPRTVLWACGFLSIPAKQPCLEVSTGQVPAGTTATFLKTFSLHICRCSRGYGVLSSLLVIICTIIMTYIHFMLVSLMMFE